MTISEIDQKIRQKEFEIGICEINEQTQFPELLYEYKYNPYKKMILQAEVEILKQEKELLLSLEKLEKKTQTELAEIANS